ncbi:MAG: carbamoyltransferase HypF, partial [Anaerolineae bacterium]|nr:carbamoyltransferase HypF [Anaerolineae bacterium]
MNERLQTLRKKIQIRGVVQGVGFRPFVYRLAHHFNLAGWVYNTSWGVEIEIEGPCPSLDGFLQALTDQTPPLARIESVTAEDIPPNGQQPFAILESRSQKGAYQLISPDVATCPDCLREVLDSTDRRYRYPFTNCTNCGPRFTIIADIPYDRPNTTMRHFTMCPECQAEYDDPLDRRFHAQPNACPECGPRVWLVDAQGDSWPARDNDVIEETARLLSEGHVLALKGLGGFHLACDATNDEAVQLLRERKRRPAKPMAVMMATLEEVRRHCDVSPEEKKLLTSYQCPIVLLRRKGASSVSPLVTLANRYLGVLLPYTPLHHVLLRDVGRPLVMTSGNLSEEPIASDNDEALQRLGHLAYYFLMHDREIHARYDDSVWLVSEVNERGGRAAEDIKQT